MDYDEGGETLDILLNLIEEQDKQKEDVLSLGNDFIQDVQDRRQRMDIYYLIRHWAKKNSLQYTWTQQITQNQQFQLHRNLHHSYTLTFSLHMHSLHQIK